MAAAMPWVAFTARKNRPAPGVGINGVPSLPDLPHHRVHIGEVPDLGELAVFEAIKSELRNST
jgi:hypothetical protein